MKMMTLDQWRRIAAWCSGVMVLACSQVAMGGGNDIAGKVTSVDGAEAGVWVIAETDDLDVVFRKIVVTDDEGRYLVPNLPKATYSLWARGYGLLDSAKRNVKPGEDVNIKVALAQTPQEAARIYPANYWFSLLNVPGVDQFPGTGDAGNGIGERMVNQAWYINRLKDGCQLCHQLGGEATRLLSAPMRDAYASTEVAWENRLQMGIVGSWMMRELGGLGKDRALEMFGDWTDRVTGGQTPVAPPRPSGVERNLVITQRGWAEQAGFVHDNVSTDKRNPSLYSNGPVYGVAQISGMLAISDPAGNKSREVMIPMRKKLPRDEGRAYGISSNPHNPMMDDKSRVWMTSSIRDSQNPDWCMNSDHPSVKRFPIQRSGRQMSFYDAAKDKMVTYDTCYGTHHLQFMDDANDTLYISGDMNVVGWIDTKKFDETGDERVAQGWCPTVLDTNGDGKIGEYVEPNEPVDPTKDKRTFGFAYGIIANPVDNTVWFARTGPDVVPGQIVRVDPETCMTENYEPPFETDAVARENWGHGPRGIDVDTNGLIWTALGSSGHIASFDRSKCKVLNGPTATGQHCPEGWTLHRTPGPAIPGAHAGENTDFHYYIWVDQFNALGLGENVPIANGSNSDSLIAWVPERQEMVTLRVPYPVGFYTRGLDGRIDKRRGWEGRGLWASTNPTAVHHVEGGRSMTSEIMHFQMRPHPLAD